MSLTTFLQIFLVLNVFVMGALAATAFRHAYAHFRPPKHEPPKTDPGVHEVRLSTASRERILQTAEANFKAALDNSASKLNRELVTTSEQLNKLVGHLGTEIVGDELERYRTDLAELRKRAQEDMGGIRAEVAKHEEELKTQLAQELEEEKLRLIKQIDTKLADAVASFLIETMQHNVDLGSQNAYIMSILEEHKADFAKEVSE